MKKSLLFAAALSFALLSCGGKTEESHEGHDMSEMNAPSAEATTVSETASTSQIIDAYLAVKDALVGDDQANAAAKSKDLVAAIGAFEGGEAVKKIQADALASAEKLAAGDIAAQRKSFETLSVTMTELLKIAGTDRTLYQQRCPMYKGNTGGIWLSASEEIKNPLFGSSMLTCGKVIETIAMN